MAGYVVRRLLWAGVLFFVLTAITYILFFAIPGSRQQARGFRAGASGEVAGQLELTGTPARQYVHFLNSAVHGSLGRSVYNRQPVTTLVEHAAPITASIIVGGIALALVIALTVGVASALRPGSLLDRGATGFVLAGISLHPAWFGLVLGYFAGYKLGWLPIGTYCDFRPLAGSCSGSTQWARHLVLPWITFAIPFAALYTRMIRVFVTEALGADHVQLARAKGAPEARVVRVHVLRMALLPLLTMLAMDVATAFVGIAFAGTIFVERVFGLPGVGSLLIQATLRRDRPVIVGVTLFVLLMILVLSLAVDLLYPLLDPRLQLWRSPFRSAERA